MTEYLDPVEIESAHHQIYCLWLHMHDYNSKKSAKYLFEVNGYNHEFEHMFLYDLTSLALQSKMAATTSVGMCPLPSRCCISSVSFKCQLDFLSSCQWRGNSHTLIMTLCP